MPGQHVRLSPSSAHRWMACPGSVALCATVPEPPSSPYAEEGTHAHALAEAALTAHCSAAIARTQPDASPAWTPEMAEYVQAYLDECETLRRHPECRYSAIETRLSLDPLGPPEPMGGTCDFLAVVGERLHVVDLKYGRGVVVEASDNPQLQYYALMALLHVEQAGVSPWDVTLTIVQPRAPHAQGAVRRIDYTADDLLAFGKRLLAAAHATHRPDAPRTAGAHCKFCPAKPVCPEQAAAVRAMVAVDFDAIPASLPDPATWSLDEIGHMLRRAEHLSDYIESCREFLLARLREGQTSTTHKLVQAQTRRRWREGADIAARLESVGFTPADLYESKLITPAEAERRLKVLGVAMPDGLVETPPGAIVLAPVEDRRPAVGVTAAHDFSH